MSSIVKDELDKIKSFADSTEKRVSKLTLNELNYISDKQLHAKGGSGEDLFPEFPVIIEVDVRNTGSATDIDNAHARYLKGGYSEIRECPTDYGGFIVLAKVLASNNIVPTIETEYIYDTDGVLWRSIETNVNMYFNPDGTITFRVVQGAQVND